MWGAVDVRVEALMGFLEKIGVCLVDLIKR
jgi:hypothetical protein